MTYNVIIKRTKKERSYLPGDKKMCDSDRYNFEELTGRVQKCLEEDGIKMSLCECSKFTKRALNAWGALDVDEICYYIVEHE